MLTSASGSGIVAGSSVSHEEGISASGSSIVAGASSFQSLGFVALGSVILGLFSHVEGSKSVGSSISFEGLTEGVKSSSKDPFLTDSSLILIS